MTCFVGFRFSFSHPENAKTPRVMIAVAIRPIVNLFMFLSFNGYKIILRAGGGNLRKGPAKGVCVSIAIKTSSDET